MTKTKSLKLHIYFPICPVLNRRQIQINSILSVRKLIFKIEKWLKKFLFNLKVLEIGGKFLIQVLTAPPHQKDFVG